MKIWDAGTYDVRKSPTIGAALEKGELKLVLSGRRLRGEWHLVRTKQEEGRNWLLFKAKDRYAGSGSDLFGGADMSRALQKPMPRSMARMEAAARRQAFQRPRLAVRACVRRQARSRQGAGVHARHSDPDRGSCGSPSRNA